MCVPITFLKSGIAYLLLLGHIEQAFLSGLEKYFEKSSITSYVLAKLLQLEEAEKRLQESQSLLARSHGPRYTLPSRSSQDRGFECVEAEPRSTTPIHGNGGCYILC